MERGHQILACILGLVFARMAGSRTFLRILCKTWDPPNNHIQDKDLALTNAEIATSAEKMTPSTQTDLDLVPYFLLLLFCRK